MTLCAAVAVALLLAALATLLPPTVVDAATLPNAFALSVTNSPRLAVDVVATYDPIPVAAALCLNPRSFTLAVTRCYSLLTKGRLFSHLPSAGKHCLSISIFARCCHSYLILF